MKTLRYDIIPLVLTFVVPLPTMTAVRVAAGAALAPSKLLDLTRNKRAWITSEASPTQKIWLHFGCKNGCFLSILTPFPEHSEKASKGSNPLKPLIDERRA